MRVPRAAAVLSLALGTGVAVAEPEPVPLSLSALGAVRVPVEINGTEPITLLLDTGSTHSILSAELSERLNLPAVARTRVLTPAGVQEALVVRVERMRIGRASRTGLTPSVVPLAQLREAEPGVDGIVGQDFLSAFDFTIDYRRKCLRWTVEHDDVQVRLPLVRAGDRSLVQLPRRAGQAPLVMVPDSGANGFVIFEREGRTAIALRDLEEEAFVSGLTSRRLARRAVLRELRVGALTLRDEPAVIVPREGEATVEGDGLLPLSRFASVAFKNTQGYLVVTR
jgi:predicted aspartyl protease